MIRTSLQGRAHSGSVFLLAILLVLSVSGCATDAQRTRTEGAAIGGAVGAGIGALAAKNTPAGAAIGGAVGALAGLVYADQVAKKKARYAQREDALRQSAGTARQVAQATRQQNDRLAAEVAGLDQRVQGLRTQKISEEARNEYARETQKRFEILQSGVDLQLSQVRQEIIRQQQVLLAEQQEANQTHVPSPPEGIQLVSNSILELQQNERLLEETRAQLQLIDAKRAY